MNATSSKQVRFHQQQVKMGPLFPAKQYLPISESQTCKGWRAKLLNVRRRGLSRPVAAAFGHFERRRGRYVAASRPRRRESPRHGHVAAFRRCDIFSNRDDAAATSRRGRILVLWSEQHQKPWMVHGNYKIAWFYVIIHISPYVFSILIFSSPFLWLWTSCNIIRL